MMKNKRVKQGIIVWIPFEDLNTNSIQELREIIRVSKSKLVAIKDDFRRDRRLYKLHGSLWYPIYAGEQYTEYDLLVVKFIMEEKINERANESAGA